MSNVPSLYELHVYDPVRREPVEAGTWTIDGQGVIGDISPIAGHEDLLARAAAELNAEGELQVRAIPSGEAIPGAMYLRGVARGAPGFLDALKEQLALYYGIDLSAATADDGEEGASGA
jgi:hypothetical protein